MTAIRRGRGAGVVNASRKEAMEVEGTPGGDQIRLRLLWWNAFLLRPPRLLAALDAEGLHCVNWSVRAGDAGNRRVRGLASRILRHVGGGDIVHERRQS